MDYIQLQRTKATRHNEIRTIKEGTFQWNQEAFRWIKLDDPVQEEKVEKNEENSQESRTNTPPIEEKVEHSAPNTPPNPPKDDNPDDTSAPPVVPDEGDGCGPGGCGANIKLEDVKVTH